jgi:hypothetical protein
MEHILRDGRIIAQDFPEGRKFWTGRGWSSEYPDAMIYISFRKARKELHERAKNGRIYCSYGFVDQHIEDAVTGQPIYED